MDECIERGEFQDAVKMSGKLAQREVTGMNGRLIWCTLMMVSYTCSSLPAKWLLHLTVETTSKEKR